MEKQLYRELIISERTPTPKGVAVYKLVYDWVVSQPDNYRIIAMKELGEEKSKWHAHILYKFEKFSEIPKKTTYRSKIQKHFGKNNTTVDWKYRLIRKSLETAKKYIFKEGNLLINKNYPVADYEKYKCKWKPKTNGTTYAEILKFLKKCKDCQGRQAHACQDDCCEAVMDYYEANENLKYNTFIMSHWVQTVYYRQKGLGIRNQLKQVLMDKSF